jgi:predicted transcriptional regulator
VSNAILNLAWKLTGLPVSQKCILARLADFADKDGQCFPGHARIATDCGLTERSVRDALRCLQERGHITIKRDVKKASRGDSVFTYRVHPTPENASGATQENASHVTPEIGASDTGKLPSRHRKTVHPTPENGARPNKRTPINQFNHQGTGNHIDDLPPKRLRQI